MLPLLNSNPEYQTHEMTIFTERKHRNALKFGTSGEVESKEGWAIAEGLELAPPNCIEVRAPQGELNGAVGEAIITQPPRQCHRTKPDFRRQNR